jgi:3-mercaptopyruvate sulfurtransferase SseA
MSCNNCEKCESCGHSTQQEVVVYEDTGFWKWAGGFFLGWLFFG